MLIGSVVVLDSMFEDTLISVLYKYYCYIIIP